MQLHNAERFPGMGRLRFPKSWRREGRRRTGFLEMARSPGVWQGRTQTRDLLVDGGAMEAQKPAEGHCFRPLAGMNLVYEPGCGRQKEGKKYPCPDCSFCQFCAETRCVACRSEKNRRGGTACRKMSLQEQVLLYEKLNAESAAAG